MMATLHPCMEVSGQAGPAQASLGYRQDKKHARLPCLDCQNHACDAATFAGPGVRQGAVVPNDHNLYSIPLCFGLLSRQPKVQTVPCSRSTPSCPARRL